MPSITTMEMDNGFYSQFYLDSALVCIRASADIVKKISTQSWYPGPPLTGCPILPTATPTTALPSVRATPLSTSFSYQTVVENDLAALLPMEVVTSVDTFVANGTLRIASLLQASVLQRAVALFSNYSAYNSSLTSSYEKQVIALRNTSMRCAECAHFLANGNSSVVRYLLAVASYSIVTTDEIAWAYLNYSSFKTTSNDSTFIESLPISSWEFSCDIVLQQEMSLAGNITSYPYTIGNVLYGIKPTQTPTMAPSTAVIAGGDGCDAGRITCSHYPGYYCLSKLCYPCPSNQYCPNLIGSYAYYCPPGEVSAPGSDHCTAASPPTGSIYLSIHPPYIKSNE